MKATFLKKAFYELSNFIDNKLKTPTGRLTLIIINCLILGGAVVHSFNITGQLTESVKKEAKEGKKADSLQLELNNHIATADERCNDKLEQGALLQQRMQQIYNQKLEQNDKIVKENERVIKEREAYAKEKLENIKALNNLKNN